MPAMASPGLESNSKQLLEAQLRATLNVIPAYTWYAAPSGGLTFTNERLSDYLGLPKDHPLRLGIDMGAEWDSHVPLLHPDDHDETRIVWSTCLRTGCAGEATFRVRNAEGAYRWFLSRAEPLRTVEGTLLYWVGVNLEIEDRKQAEEKLRSSEAHLIEALADVKKSEDRLRLVVDSIPALIHTARPDGYLDYFNRRWLEYLGVTLDKVAGWNWTAFIHPEDVDGILTKWRACLATAEIFEHETRVRMANGDYRWMFHRKVPLRDSNGNIVKWYGSSLDIDERKAGEEKIRAQESELRQMLDFTPQYLGVLGADGTPIYANRSSLDYLGMSLSEWRQRKQIGEEVHPDDLERVTSELDRALSTGSAVEIEERVRKGDGSFRWFLSRCNPVRDENGQMTRLYLASTDIHDRKTAEERLQQENVALREEIDKASMFEEIIGTSPALKNVLSRISKVAPSDSTVLITGETGTGKELVARAIHRRSPRGPRPFVSMNCAAIPRDLIASELFGHEKGAFTGATQQRLGRFELANGGTIFLDEVGELPPETQIALLRVLQEHEFERVGGSRRIRVDVRVIAATNRDLQAAISAGSFRSDLFYRLNVFPIAIPSLQERREDIPLLVEYFIDRYARKARKEIRSVNKKTLQLLQSYPWPGNIRELQNVIERSVILCETEIFSIDEHWLPQSPPLTLEPKHQVELPAKLLVQEKNMIEAALKESRGRVSGPTGAAAKLGIPRSTLESKIRSLKINKTRFKT
jgi:PAS domain S-box-containing protein